MKNHLLSVLVVIGITASPGQAQTPILWGMTSAGGANNTGVIFKYSTATATETNVHNFGNGVLDGNQPEGSLIRASNGLLYGMTPTGGANSLGIIFSYNVSTGEDSILYNF